MGLTLNFIILNSVDIWEADGFFLTRAWKLFMSLEMSLVYFFLIGYNYYMLRSKLQEDQIAALKAGDKVKLSVLRFVISEVKNREIEKKTELNDEETLAVLKKFTKELKESIEAFTKGNRPELVEENKKQLEVVSQYLPKEISDEELNAEIEKLLTENKAQVEQNPKSAIGLVMGRLKSKADPSRIMPILKSRLSL